ncbi:MAG TPA: hypothetical protein VG734_02145 [Lacunisphaera sp.]|nr:hypothetical protein [Lacunisphaera sp.]
MFPRHFHACGLLLAISLPAATLQASPETLTVTISTEAGKSYRRQRLPDGTFKPEFYVMANGGLFRGTTRDESFDYVTYEEVAGKLKEHLARQQYLLADKAADADLFLVVYWGQTVPYNDGTYRNSVDQVASAINDYKLNRIPSSGIGGGNLPMINADRGPPSEQNPAPTEGLSQIESAMARVQMENLGRDSANLENAKLLGYLDAINERRHLPPWADVSGITQELTSDIEEPRYYIVIGAYDFRLMQEKRKQVLRWATRISIGSQGTSFDDRMAQMVAAAAASFGQPNGFRRRYFGDPRVDLGETKFIGVVGGEGVNPVKPVEPKK